MSEIDEAEVERLAAQYDDAHDAECDRLGRRISPAAVARWAHQAGIRAVLADLSSRWHLVPREVEERTEWGAQSPVSGKVLNVAEEASEQRGPWPLVRRTVRTIPDGNGGTWVHASAWQVVEEAKP